MGVQCSDDKLVEVLVVLLILSDRLKIADFAKCLYCAVFWRFSSHVRVPGCKGSTGMETRPPSMLGLGSLMAIPYTL